MQLFGLGFMSTSGIREPRVGVGSRKESGFSHALGCGLRLKPEFLHPKP